MPNEQHQRIECAERAAIVASVLGRLSDEDEEQLIALYEWGRTATASRKEP